LNKIPETFWWLSLVAYCKGAFIFRMGDWPEESGEGSVNFYPTKNGGPHLYIKYSIFKNTTTPFSVNKTCLLN